MLSRFLFLALAAYAARYGSLTGYSVTSMQDVNLCVLSSSMTAPAIDITSALPLVTCNASAMQVICSPPTAPIYEGHAL